MHIDFVMCNKQLKLFYLNKASLHQYEYINTNLNNKIDYFKFQYLNSHHCAYVIDN